MTRLLNRTGHAAVHGLAMRTGCRCPDCGTGGRPRRVAFDEDLYADEGPTAEERCRTMPAGQGVQPPRPWQNGSSFQEPRSPGTRPPAPPEGMLPALQRVLTSLGWSDWSSPVGMADLVDFSLAGGVTRFPPQGRNLCVSTEGRALLSGGRFRALAPYFQAQGHCAYRIVRRGQGALYIGMANRPPGLRVLQHLHFARETRSPIGRALNWAAVDRGRLGDFQVTFGRLPGAATTRRAHLGEIALMELATPRLNPPSGLGFDNESEW